MSDTKEKTTNTAVSSNKSKKTKIIISIVCASIIVLGIIAGIIATCIKRFDISETDEFKFYNFNEMVITSPDYSITNIDYEIHSNATRIVQNTQSKNYGVYSYFENKTIIPADYAQLEKIETEHRTLFKASRLGNDITLFDDEGEKLDITNYNIHTDKTTAKILEKNTTIKKKRSSVKVKTKHSFIQKDIVISDAQYKDTLTRGEYEYEIWTLTDEKGNTYDNVYLVEDEDRELVCTLNSLVGANIGAINQDSLPKPYIQSNGDLSFITETITTNGQDTVHNVIVFNQDFEEEDSQTIIENDTLSSFFLINDYVVLQYKIPASEKKYDFAEFNGLTNTYYTLETYKFNLKNGDLNEVNFDYVISNANQFANTITNSVQVYAQKIHNKTLENAEYLILNKKLQTKKIDFKIESLKKINDERYLAKSDGGYYVIDENFNKEAYIGNYDNVFATEESLMLSNISSDYIYICSLDGTIARRYFKHDVIITHDQNHYIVQEQSEIDGTEYTNYYTERLGARESQPIYTRIVENSSTSFTSNDTNYNNITYSLLDNRESDTKGQNISLGIITKIWFNGTYYVYDFYNLTGKKLASVGDFSSNTAIPQIMYSEDDKILIRLTEKADFETYIVAE